jgi:hypothetical protein
MNAHKAYFANTSYNSFVVLITGYRENGFPGHDEKKWDKKTLCERSEQDCERS